MEGIGKMEKLLSISIAAYNVEKYIEQALDSLIIPGKMDKFEVFIVDDGGSDNTLEIAKQYHSKYPNTFIPVHKENGGYGSTFNYSINHACGKYFKLLDGDDWFDTEGFSKLLDILENEESEAIITNYYKGYDVNHLDKVITHNNIEETISNESDFLKLKHPFGMWEIVYKTDFIRKINLVLPEHELYTDRYYSTVPFAFLKSIRFANVFVYCYRVERDGQSMSVESQVKHHAERIKGSIELCKFYKEQKILGNPRCSYLLHRIAVSHVAAASVFRYLPKGRKRKKQLDAYEKKIYSISKDIVSEEKNCGKFGLYLTMCRKSKYLLYWLTPSSVLKKKGKL